MEAMSDFDFDWAPPSDCLRCHQPVAADGDRCLNCGMPVRLLSTATTEILVEKGAHLGSQLFQLTANLILIAAALYACWYISPFLILFPLFFVFTQNSDD